MAKELVMAASPEHVAHLGGIDEALRVLLEEVPGSSS